MHTGACLRSLVPRSRLIPAGPRATCSRKPPLSPGAGRCPPEQASQGHSPLPTLIRALPPSRPWRQSRPSAVWLG